MSMSTSCIISNTMNSSLSITDSISLLCKILISSSNSIKLVNMNDLEYRKYNKKLYNIIYERLIDYDSKFDISNNNNEECYEDRWSIYFNRLYLRYLALLLQYNRISESDRLTILIKKYKSFNIPNTSNILFILLQLSHMNSNNNNLVNKSSNSSIINITNKFYDQPIKSDEYFDLKPVIQLNESSNDNQLNYQKWMKPKVEKKIDRDLLSLESLASNDTGFFMKRAPQAQPTNLTLRPEPSFPTFNENTNTNKIELKKSNFSFAYFPENIPSKLVDFKNDWSSSKMLETDVQQSFPKSLNKSFNHSSDITADAYNTLKQILPLAYPSKNTPFQVTPSETTVYDELKTPCFLPTLQSINTFSQLKITEFAILALQGIPSQIFELYNFTLNLRNDVNLNVNISSLKIAAKIGTLFLHIQYFSNLQSCGILENVKEKLKEYCILYLKWFQNIDLIGTTPEEDLLWKNNNMTKLAILNSKSTESESVFLPLDYKLKCFSIVGLFSVCSSIFSEITYVFQLCKDIHSMEGHEILSYLYSKCNISNQHIVSYMLKYIMEPYFEMLKIWLYKGEIHDPFHEFFIRNEFSCDQSNILNYKLVPSNIPTFLKPIAKNIFEAGQNVSWMRKDFGIMNCVLPGTVDKLELCYNQDKFLEWESYVLELLSEQILNCKALARISFNTSIDNLDNVKDDEADGIAEVLREKEILAKNAAQLESQRKSSILAELKDAAEKAKEQQSDALKKEKELEHVIALKIESERLKEIEAKKVEIQSKLNNSVDIDEWKIRRNSLNPQRLLAMMNTQDERADIKVKLHELALNLDSTMPIYAYETELISTSINIQEIPESPPIDLFTPAYDNEKPDLETNSFESNTVNAATNFPKNSDSNENLAEKLDCVSVDSDVDIFSIQSAVELDADSEHGVYENSESDSYSSFDEIKEDSVTADQSDESIIENKTHIIEELCINEEILAIEDSTLDKNNLVSESLLSFKLPDDSKFRVLRPKLDCDILACALSGSISKLVSIQTKLVDVASITFIMQNNIKSDFELLKLYMLMQAGDIMDSFCRQIFQTIWRPDFMTKTFQNACSINFNYSDKCKRISILTTHNGTVVDLSNFDSLSLKLDVNFPNNLVINDASISSYNSIFRLLLKTKYVSFELSELWKNLQLSKALFSKKHGDKSKFDSYCKVWKARIHALNLFRNEMFHFIHVIQNHLIIQILNSCAKFESEYEKLESLQALIEKHLFFINRCQEKCFLDNRHLPFMKMLLDLFGQMVRFKKLIDGLNLPFVFQYISTKDDIKLSSTLSDNANKKYELILSAVRDFRKSIDFLYKLLVKLIERGVPLHNLLLSLDFNSFYQNKNKVMF